MNIHLTLQETLDTKTNERTGWSFTYACRKEVWSSTIEEPVTRNRALVISLYTILEHFSGKVLTIYVTDNDINIFREEIIECSRHTYLSSICYNAYEKKRLTFLDSGLVSYGS